MIRSYFVIMVLLAVCVLGHHNAHAQNANVAIEPILPGAEPVMTEPSSPLEAATVAVPLANDASDQDEIITPDTTTSAVTTGEAPVESVINAEALSSLSLAQDGLLQGQTSGAMTSIERVIADMISIRKPGIDITRTTSLFFTKEQRDQMLEARRKSLIVEMDSDEMITGDPYGDAPDGKGSVSKSGPREIVLGGISYKSSDEWTIWLNQMRITPALVPKPIQYLRVHKDYIELEWLDVNTNQIYPVRLRPHQRFNIDTRLFLPG